MRPIDADALKKEILETYEHEYPTASGAFDEFASRIVPNIISNAPAIDAVPVVHGRWIARNPLIREPFGKNYDCSVCGVNNIQYNFCPNCGARMNLEDEP